MSAIGKEVDGRLSDGIKVEDSTGVVWKRISDTGTSSVGKIRTWPIEPVVSFKESIVDVEGSVIDVGGSIKDFGEAIIVVGGPVFVAGGSVIVVGGSGRVVGGSSIVGGSVLAVGDSVTGIKNIEESVMNVGGSVKDVERSVNNIVGSVIKLKEEGKEEKLVWSVEDTELSITEVGEELAMVENADSTVDTPLLS